MKRAFLLCLLFGIAVAAAAQNPVVDRMTREDREVLAGTKNGPTIAAYEFEGKPVYLRQNLHRVAIELDDSTRYVSLRANRALRTLTNVRPLSTPRNDYTRGRFVMQWQDDVETTASWTAQANKVRANAAVKAVWPVYSYPQTNVNIYCPGEIAVKLNAGVTTQTVMQVAGKYGLYATSARPNDLGVIVLRMKDPLSSDPFALSANLTTDTEHFAWASPNLTQGYKLTQIGDGDLFWYSHLSAYNRWFPWPATKAFVGTDPLLASQWHLPLAHFPETWDAMKNSNRWPVPATEIYPFGYEQVPTIAILDTGVDWVHEDIGLNTWKNAFEYQDEDNPIDGIDNDWDGLVDDVVGWNFADDSNNPYGAAPHGTSCAGIAGARGYNGLGGRGGSPYLGVMAVKIVKDDGITFIDDAKIATAMAYASRYANVISCSWGGGAPTVVLHDAIVHCLTFGRGGYRWDYITGIYQPVYRAAGTPVFFAAGNNSDNTPIFPASDKWAIAVGATDQKDMRFDYSNSGLGIDVTAPAGAVTTDITGAPGYSAGNYTTTFGGTSSATPLAAASALLALGYNRKDMGDGSRTANIWDGLSTRSIPYDVYIYNNRWTGAYMPRTNQNDLTIWQNDPRLYTAGELAQTMIHGTDRVNLTHGNYDPTSHSLQYGWGRINALKIFKGLPNKYDDPFEEKWPASNIAHDDPSQATAQYLRPGLHKWMLARDSADYFKIPMEPGSSARITVTCLRLAKSAQNDWDPPTKARYGKYTDETTSPRLKVELYPALDRYDVYGADGKNIHTGPEVDADGVPTHPTNITLTNKGQTRMEDIIQVDIPYIRYDFLKADKSIDWDRTNFYQRSDGNTTTTYYLIVTPLEQYVDPTWLNRSGDARYRPVVEYTLNYEYYPAPQPHHLVGGGNAYGGYAFKDGKVQVDIGPDGIATPGGLSHQVRSFATDAVDILPDRILPKGTTIQSVSYSPVQKYEYFALTEPYHAGDPSRASVDEYRFPVDYRTKVNVMVTFDPTQSAILTHLRDEYDNKLTWSEVPEEGVEAIFDYQPARKQTYNIETGTWGTGKPNNYFFGVHYSVVGLVTGTTAPLEFHPPTSGKLDLDYYPYEHLKASDTSKKYTLSVNNKQGARVSIAQLDRLSDWRVWMYASDSAGLPVATSVLPYPSQHLVLPPQDKATSYTITTFVYYVGTEIPPPAKPTDMRYQLAIDRTRLPGTGFPVPQNNQLTALPDVWVKSITFEPNLTVPPREASNRDPVKITSLVVENKGGGTMQRIMSLWNPTLNGGHGGYEDKPRTWMLSISDNFTPKDTTKQASKPTNLWISVPIMPRYSSLDICSTGPITLGDGKTTASYPTSGTVDLSISLDPGNYVKEISETNNDTTYEFDSVNPAAALAFNSPIAVSPSDLDDKTVPQINFTVRNAGKLDMKGTYTVEIWSTSGGVPKERVSSFTNFSGLAAGAEYPTGLMSLGKTFPVGSYPFVAKLVPNNPVDNPNGNNSQKDFSVNVTHKAAVPTPTPTPGPLGAQNWGKY